LQADGSPSSLSNGGSSSSSNARPSESTEEQQEEEDTPENEMAAKALLFEFFHDLVRVCFLLNQALDIFTAVCKEDFS
jgi:hypothetical protein